MNTKEIILNILCESFSDNPSVNFVIKQDKRREKRIRLLMEYSYYYCEAFGKIYLNEAKNCCALIIEPDKKSTTLKSILWDIKLAFACVGISNIGKVLKREAEIKKTHPSEPFIHLWYVGVNNNFQGKGLGTEMVHLILEESKKENKSVYLETSNPKNFPFYTKLGFIEHAELSALGYGLKAYKQ